MFNENDIRPKELMKLKEPALEHDKCFLREKMSSFIYCHCPACKSSSSKLWGEKEGFRYVKCSECNTVYMNPRAPEKILKEFYKQSKNYEFWDKYIYPQTDLVRKEKIFRPRVERLIDLCKKYNVLAGTILEIGSGFGTFCETLAQYNFFNRIIAVEPTPDLANTCKNKGIETIESEIESSLPISEGSMDVIVNFEVIEHLADPNTFVSKASRYLKQGGLFICTCPNGESIGAFLLKENAKFVDHEHLNYFNPTSIKKLLKGHQLEVVEISTPGELDVDLLINYFQDHPDMLKENDFLRFMFSNINETKKSHFQSFIQQNNLSSCMWVVARKD